MQTILLLALAGGALLLLAAVTHFSGQGSLNNIKSKTVGDGQHGTARWATKKEIQQTYAHVPFRPEEWRKGERLPKKQGLVLGCEGRKDHVIAIVDTDDMDEIRHAAKIAQIDDFIDGLEDGYQTHVAQGGNNFSGGQKQRLSIARALVKKPEIYVFDDSFSALDFKTDAKLRAALRDEVKNAAVIIVAQRISTIMDADQIVVLDEGRVAGIGTHDQLLKNCEVYRQIARSQLREEELA